MLAEVIGGLTTMLAKIADLGSRKTELHDQALAAIYAAANETRIYIAHTLQTKGPDQQREAELARLWTKAAVPVRHVDPDLADRCLLKADYWINPDRWTVGQVREFRIGLDNIYDYARQLLRE
jgi:hypothetical protein